MLVALSDLKVNAGKYVDLAETEDVILLDESERKGCQSLTVPKCTRKFIPRGGFNYPAA
jgi:hypothetical protein